MLALLAHPAAEHERIGEHACKTGWRCGMGLERRVCLRAACFSRSHGPYSFLGGHRSHTSSGGAASSSI